MTKGFVPWVTSDGQRIGWKLSEGDYLLMLKTNKELSQAHLGLLFLIQDYNKQFEIQPTEIKCKWYQFACKRDRVNLDTLGGNDVEVLETP